MKKSETVNVEGEGGGRTKKCESQYQIPPTHLVLNHKYYLKVLSFHFRPTELKQLE